MIDTSKLTIIDTVAYALDDIKSKLSADEYQAFTKWFGNKPYHISTMGTKCILASDFQLYLRLRTNALKRVSNKQ